MLICDKCGTAAEKGKFCKGCGGPLREFFSVKQTGSSSVVLTCTKCGKESSDGRFCIFCGGELIAGKPREAQKDTNSTVSAPTPAPTPVNTAENKASGLVCSKCGKEFEKGKFCTVCGGDLVPAGSADKASEQPAAPTPAPVPSPIPAQTSAPTPVTSTENKASGLVCSKCGKEFEKGKFCTVCGGDLIPADSAVKAPEQPAAPTPVPAPSPVPSPVNVADNKASGLVCSKCGKEFEKGKFCTVCGGDLVPADSAVKAPEQPAAPTSAPVSSPIPAQTSEPTPAPAPSPIPAQTSAPSPTPVNTAENKASGKLVCEGCGKEFEKGKFCTVCGGNLIPASGSVPAPQTPPCIVPPPVSASSQGGNLRCSSCGNVMSKGKFCTVCGGTLVPMDGAPAPASQGMHCPQCGKIFDKGKFCTVCGVELVN